MATLGTEVLSSSDSDGGEEVGECLVEVSTLPPSNLKQVLESILKEKLIVNSSFSQQVCYIVNKCLTDFKSEKVDKFNSMIEREICKCFNCTSGTIPLSKIWRNFHVLRLSDPVRSAWKSCLVDLPSDVKDVSYLTLQLILRRMFQEVVQQMTVKNNPLTVSPQRITPREENAIRYMAGYIVVKLKKKYTSYVDFFQSIHVSIDEAHIETVQDFTRIWTEQIDRGGLYHVNDTFFKMIKEIEITCRKYLDIRVTPTDDLVRKIKQDALHSHAITHSWDNLASSIQSDASSNMLKDIIKLWTNIRVHSFAEKWTEKFEKGHKKSIRKTLKQKNTEKEND